MSHNHFKHTFPRLTPKSNTDLIMLSIQVLAVFLVIIVPCVSQSAPGFGCNDTFLMVELHKCEKTMLQVLIDDPSANCSEEVHKLQQCSRTLIVDQCYSSLYAFYPKLRRSIEEMMDVTLKQVNKASFYCSDHKMKINWEMIPNAVKRVLPCDRRFFDESLKCAEKFRMAFNNNKKDPNLCRLYTETKRCSHRVSYIYCTSSTILSVNKLNPFCEGGMDIEEIHRDNSISTRKPLKCIAHVCSNSSSSFYPTPPCALPQEVTCETPQGLPFEYDACMTTRITMEPVTGVTISQVNRNCSSTFLCNSNVFCTTANRTGLIKTCDVECCSGEMCNKGNLPQTSPQTTKHTVKRIKCISSICSKSSLQHLSDIHCEPGKEVTCESPPDVPFMYDRCMTTSLSVQPINGVTVEQEIRNCSYSFQCQPELFCGAANTTGLVKRCEVRCCEGNLCNKKYPPKPTTRPQELTPKATLRPVSKTPKKSYPKRGFWTKVTPSWILDHVFHGIRVQYRTVNKGLAIEGHVTSYGCQRMPGSGLTTFIRGNWTQIMYTQEFRGSASCWRIFGNSGRKGYLIKEGSGLEDYSPRKGDIIFNELKMGGENDDVFKGRTHMCGRPGKNFWHAQNGLGLRRATVMLRRKTKERKAGIHTATSCGQPSFVIKDIFVYH